MDRLEATHLWDSFRRSGDSAIFDRLYRAYRMPVMRYCRARLGDEEVAEEIADRVFAYLAVKTPACTGSFPSLLFFYARLRCANYRSPPRLQPLPELPTKTPPPSTTAETEERNKKIESALGQLTDEEREVVLLHLFVGLSLSEIARITSISRWKLSRRCHRALRNLHHILRKSDV